MYHVALMFINMLQQTGMDIYEDIKIDIIEVKSKKCKVGDDEHECVSFKL